MKRCCVSHTIGRGRRGTAFADVEMVSPECIEFARRDAICAIRKHIAAVADIDTLLEQHDLRILIDDDEPQLSLGDIRYKATANLPAGIARRKDVVKLIENVRNECKLVEVYSAERHEKLLADQGRKTGLVK
jgi:hypothetical protein